MTDQAQTGIDASEMTGEDRPQAGGENRPGAQGDAGGANRVTVPDPTGEDNSSSTDQPV